MQPSDEFHLGAKKKRAGKLWVSVTLPSGTTGFIPGGTVVCIIRNATIAQENLDIRDAPALDAGIVATYRRGASFRHAGLVNRNGAQSIEVRTPSGKVGYVPPGSAVTLSNGADAHLAGACGTIFFVGGLSLVLGTIGVLTDSTVLPGWLGVIGGAVMLVLGYLAQRRSKVALAIAIAIWCLELLSRAFVALQSLGPHQTTPSAGMIGSLVFGFFLLKSMWGGIAALDMPNAELATVDWQGNSKTEKANDCATAPALAENIFEPTGSGVPHLVA